MFTLDFLKGSAIVAFIIGFWDKIKTVLWRLASIVIQRNEIKTEEAHDAIIAYLVKNYKRLPSYDKVFGANNVTFRDGKYGLVPYEQFGTTTIIFRENKGLRWSLRVPFIFNQPKQESTTVENRGYQEGSDKIYSTITCFRGTLDIDTLILNATKMRNDISWKIDEEENKTANRFDIFYLPNKENNNHAYFSKSSVGYAWYNQSQYKLIGIDQNDIGREMSNGGKALDNLYFPEEIKALIKIISLWIKSRDWYKERNIPWKRGWLLYGPPGTGKTALARAFAEDLNMPIYVFSLSQMSNNDLMDSWKNMQLNIPCIALIEDIDNVFHGRKNIAQNAYFTKLLTSNDSNDDDDNSSTKTPLTFDCLLNCIDGIDRSNGVFTIITTNDITKIDSAIGHPQVKDGKTVFISSRPGRIDKAIELTYMTKEGKIQMCKKILGEFPEKEKEIMAYIDKNEKETPAQFQEFCAEVAIQEYWNKREVEASAISSL